MFEPVGYCTIKKDADCSKPGVMGVPSDWQGQDVRVMEFADHSKSVLVISRDAAKMAMFDYSDMARSFKCGFIGEVITPPDLNPIQQMAYSTKVMSRKGGYNQILRQMVIQASLMKGEFNDNFLFQKEKEEKRETEREYDRLKRILRNHKLKQQRKNPRKERRLLRRLKANYRPSPLLDLDINALGAVLDNLGKK